MLFTGGIFTGQSLILTDVKLNKSLILTDVKQYIIAIIAKFPSVNVPPVNNISMPE